MRLGAGEAALVATTRQWSGEDSVDMGNGMATALGKLAQHGKLGAGGRVEGEGGREKEREGG